MFRSDVNLIKLNKFKYDLDQFNSLHIQSIDQPSLDCKRSSKPYSLSYQLNYFYT